MKVIWWNRSEPIVELHPFFFHPTGMTIRYFQQQLFLVCSLLAWENSQHFAISPRNDVWETSAEIPFWWRAKIAVVMLLFDWKSASTSRKYYPDLGSDAPSVWNFCACFSDVNREMSAVFQASPLPISSDISCGSRSLLGLSPSS